MMDYSSRNSRARRAVSRPAGRNSRLLPRAPEPGHVPGIHGRHGKLVCSGIYAALRISLTLVAQGHPLINSFESRPSVLLNTGDTLTMANPLSFRAVYKVVDGQEIDVDVYLPAPEAPKRGHPIRELSLAFPYGEKSAHNSHQSSTSMEVPSC